MKKIITCKGINLMHRNTSCITIKKMLQKGMLEDQEMMMNKFY